jgi:mono/diheme cytochrome c family protein
MRNGRALGFAVATALTTVAASSLSQAPATVDSHFAAANNRALVILGKQLYIGHCAGCHGRFLQGQPLWQLADSYAGARF